MEPVTSGGGEHSSAGGLQEKLKTTTWQMSFDLDSCLEQGVGLRVPFPLNDFMI